MIILRALLRIIFQLLQDEAICYKDGSQM